MPANCHFFAKRRLSLKRVFFPCLGFKKSVFSRSLVGFFVYFPHIYIYIHIYTHIFIMIQLLRVILVKQYDSKLEFWGTYFRRFRDANCQPDPLCFFLPNFTFCNCWVLHYCMAFYCASYDQHQRSVINKNQLAAI